MLAPFLVLLFCATSSLSLLLRLPAFFRLFGLLHLLEFPSDRRVVLHRLDGC